MQREREKNPSKGRDVWDAALLGLTTVSKVAHKGLFHHDSGATPQQARISTLLLEYSRSRAVLGTTLQNQLVSLGDTKKAKMLVPRPLGPTIRHWWPGRVDRQKRRRWRRQ